jgi:hypothetical protein
MIFENGRVIVRGGNQMPVIEPIGDSVSADELAALFERHGFSQDDSERENSETS